MLHENPTEKFKIFNNLLSMLTPRRAGLLFALALREATTSIEETSSILTKFGYETELENPSAAGQFVLYMAHTPGEKKSALFGQIIFPDQNGETHTMFYTRFEDYFRKQFNLQIIRLSHNLITD